MPQRIELSLKAEALYPQLSLDPLAMGTVMPGVHFAWPVAVPHEPPMLGVAGEQSDPLQQRLGLGAVCGVQVSPLAHAPVESQRQPRWPATHVAVTLGGAPVPVGIVQSEPMQQVSGVGAAWGVHVRPGAQMPGS